MTDNIPEGFTISKSRGRIGYEYVSPKGHTYYNFLTPEDALNDIMMWCKK